FFIYKKETANASGDEIFIQIGSETNYYEYSINSSELDQVDPAEWHLIRINQIDDNKDGKPDRWSANDNFGAIKTVGNPSFSSISQIKVGVRTSANVSGIWETGEIWINEIHVADSWKKEGDAWRLNADLKWPGWFSTGGKRKSIDRNFQTFSGGIYNRDYLEDTAYFNLDRIRFLPIKTNLNRTRTVTPSVIDNQNELVSILEEGRVINYNGSVSASPNLRMFFSPVTRYVHQFNLLLPSISGTYSRNITDTHQIEKLEDKETLSGNANYNFPVRLQSFFPFMRGINVFPSNVSGNYSISNSFFYKSGKAKDSDTFLAIDSFNDYLVYFSTSNYNTLEITKAWSARAPFQFWRGFGFSPSYSLSEIEEKNKIFQPYGPEHEAYPKSANQKIAATSDLRIFAWLYPRMSYDINISENYDLSFSTANPAAVLFPSENKIIERRSNGNVTWNFQVKDVFRFKYTESLGFSSSYSQQDSDLYENVEKKYPIIGRLDSDKLWIRGNSLRKDLPTSATTYFIIKSIVEKDDSRLSGRYNPLEAFNFPNRISPFKTLSTNFTYTDSKENKYTGDWIRIYSILWPDFNVGLSQWEKFFYAEKWVSNSTLNFRHNKKVTTTVNTSEGKLLNYGSDLRFTIFKKFDLSFSGSLGTNQEMDLIENLLTKEGEATSLSSQAGFNITRWRFTVGYQFANNWEKDGTGKETQQLTTQTGTIKTHADMSFPRGLPIPFTNRTIPLKNRLVFDSTIKYVEKASPLNVEKDNTNQYSYNSTVDYEVSQNFRTAIGIGYSYLQNRHNDDENYHSIEASFKLTIQF
ncbi:MAG: hypothetical protein JW871_01335, partial [Endomicrobiales bacterium]|nr:hypothetical protein [Endomicrobiales bacterium]